MTKVNYKTLFLRQSYIDSYDTFCNSLNGKVPLWDYIVLTASNDSQAKAYWEQIEYRKKIGVLPKTTKYAVVSDRDGKRCGSGGATLTVLSYIAKQENITDFSNLKILCIHSGGDSKRVPQYSACGKIFSPVPRQLPDGRCSTLFDEFVIGMSGIPARIKNGLLVCSGDVLLLFNPLQLDFYTEGAAALSIKEKVETGKNHGVFLGNKEGNVAKCLQKQSIEVLKQSGAVDSNGNVDIDTGAVIFSGSLVNALYSLVDNDKKFDELVNDKVRLSFYADFLYPLAKDSTLEKFYKEKPEGEFSEQLTKARELIWSALSKFSMKLIRFSPSMFLHFGTTSELLKLVYKDIDNYKFLDWTLVTNCNVKTNRFAVYNSYIGKHNKIGKGCYIENSDILENVTVGENSVISGITVSDINIPSNVVLHGLKLGEDRYVCRMYGIEDNPKESFYLGKKIDMPLWTKPLFKVCATMSDAVISTLNFEKDGELLSLSDSFNMADTTAILQFANKLNDKIIAESIISNVESGIPVSEFVKNYKDGVSSRVEKYILQKTNKLDEGKLYDFSKKVRVLFYLSKLIDGEKLTEKCFSLIRDAILKAEIKNIEEVNTKIAKEEVVVNLPVRVNWGGGWSDTPPYCNEKGGRVLNAAISLDGKNPIEVTLKKTDKKTIYLSSTDIGSYKEFTDIEELQDCSNPTDAFALHKAALIACGIVPKEKQISVAEICDKLGGGIYFNTRVINIPKGSGLGTSSILAGACVKAIYQFIDQQKDDSEIFARVSCMEQLMSTGGGWQDQVGGIVSGIKLISSESGLCQKITYRKLNISEKTYKELSDRFVLIYTGQRRLARNLLREVIGRYIGANEDAVYVLNEIKNVANDMTAALEKGNVDEFARLLSKHWDLSKKLDMGCTNTCIDQMLLTVQDLTEGQMICGAGGGGFIQVILKKNVTINQLKRRLNNVFADSGVGVWKCDFVR